MPSGLELKFLLGLHHVTLCIVWMCYCVEVLMSVDDRKKNQSLDERHQDVIISNNHCRLID